MEELEIWSSLAVAVLTGVALVVAIFAMVWQSRLTYRALGVGILRDYDREFSREAQLVRARLSLATYLLNRLNREHYLILTASGHHWSTPGTLRPEFLP